MTSVDTAAEETQVDSSPPFRGWVGPWIAYSVLFGWFLWHALAHWVSPHTPGIVAAILTGLCLWPLLSRGCTFLGRTVPILGLWISVGVLCGARATHPFPGAPPHAASLLEAAAGEPRYHLVQVESAQSSHWEGRLYASLLGGEWCPIEPAARVWGAQSLEENGAWAFRGTLGLPPPRDPARVGQAQLDVVEAYGFSLGRDEVPFGLLPDRALPRALDLWTRARDRCRGAVVRRWKVRLGDEVGSFAAWVLLGVRPENAGSIREPFVRTGTAHLLAISGLHVGIVAGVVWTVLRLVVRPPRRARRLTSLLLLVYAFFTGGAVSVLRSAGMFLLLAWGPAWGRLGRGWNALGWAAALLPLVRPELPARPGYLLSVAATAGVLLGARVGEGWVRRIRPGGGVGAEPGRAVTIWLLRSLPPIGASMGAQTATWSLGLGFFSLASGTGLLFNLVAVPLAAVVVPLLFLAGWTAFLPEGFLTRPIDVLARVLAETLLASVALLSRSARIVIGGIEATAALGLSVAALVALWGLSRAVENPATRGGRILTLLAAVVVFGFLLPTLAAFSHGAPASGFRATFLDVGQGDAILLECAGERWLYDLGPAYPRRLVPELLRRGVARLDRVFVTHGDQDHWGGLSALLRSPIRVDTLAISASGPWPGRFWETLESDGRNGPRARPVVERIGAGWTRSYPCLRARVLHPPGSSAGFRAEGRNDHSIVLHLEAPTPHGSRGTGRLLLVGDLEEPGQQRLLREQGPVPAVVAQAGHHGSATSLAEGWYESVDPRLVVVSLGKDNRYGFPHPELLDRLRGRRARWLRTDDSGSITLTWDGSRWSVRRGRAEP